jgi:hypothetical protein
MSAFTPTFAGKPIMEASLDVPRRGLWTARISVESDSTIVGQGELSLVSGMAWSGTIVKGELYHGRLDLIVVGGRNGLAKVLSPKAFVVTKLAAILSDSLRECGETMADDSQGALDGYSAHWVRMAQPCVQVLDAIASQAGLDWSADYQGRIYLAKFAAYTPSFAFDLLDKDVASGKLMLTSEAGLILPGHTIEGLTVQRAAHQISGASVRTTAWVTL